MDEAKARSNYAKHGVRFEDATYVFDDPWRLEDVDQFSKGEYRRLCIGRAGGTVLVVVYAEPEESAIRMISARAATAHERRAYEASFLHP